MKQAIVGLSLLLASAGVFAADDAAAPAAQGVAVSPADDAALQNCIASKKPQNDADKAKAKDDCMAQMSMPQQAAPAK